MTLFPLPGVEPAHSKAADSACDRGKLQVLAFYFPETYACNTIMDFLLQTEYQHWEVDMKQFKTTEVIDEWTNAQTLFDKNYLVHNEVVVEVDKVEKN